ncbi:MAG TPA: erythromycin esterase family protein [Enhygromyxa sp.]|nr:erythromycin esterase family protein [Enhygromyxa sp.]
MGRHLAEQLGDGFVNVGFVFAQGDFLARDRDTPDRTIHTFSLPHGPPEGLGPRLASGGMPMFALDLRTSPADSLRTWLSEPAFLAPRGRLSWSRGRPLSRPFARFASEADRHVVSGCTW